MGTLLQNIGLLVPVGTPGELWKKGPDLQQVHAVANAWLHVADGKVAGLGPMNSCPTVDAEPVDATGRLVLPGFVDAHTHLIFSHTRENELLLRLQGHSYEEIAAAGGGILESAARLQAAPEAELLAQAEQRAAQLLRLGTTTLEVKSGYGLTLAAELKMLRVARQLQQRVPQQLKVTLLAAHALPTVYRHNRQAYIRLICDEMIPQAAAEGLADYVDVFCERGFFTPEETLTVLAAGARYGLAGRVHANELYRSGGVQAAVQAGATSADHLECVEQEELDLLATSATVPVLLPGTAFFLDIPYAPARQMVDAGLGIALASDYNPGTCPSGNMAFVIALACLKMKLLPAEALVAATLNAAHALGLAATTGSLAVGKRADLLVTQPLPSLAALPYFFAHPLVDKVMIAGEWV